MPVGSWGSARGAAATTNPEITITATTAAAEAANGDFSSYWNAYHVLVTMRNPAQAVRSHSVLPHPLIEAIIIRPLFSKKTEAQRG